MTTALTLSDVRDALARALTEQARLEAQHKEALSAWEAEMHPLLEARAAIKARVKELDLDVRAEIQATYGFEGGIPALTGLSVQLRDAVEYDADALKAWAEAHAPELLRTELVGEKALLAWLADQPEQIDMETGEKVRVLATEAGPVRIPAAIVKRVTPVVSERALITYEDERRWNAERQAAPGLVGE